MFTTHNPYREINFSVAQGHMICRVLSHPKDELRVVKDIFKI